MTEQEFGDARNLVAGCQSFTQSAMFEETCQHFVQIQDDSESFSQVLQDDPRSAILPLDSARILDVFYVTLILTVFKCIAVILSPVCDRSQTMVKVNDATTMDELHYNIDDMMGMMIPITCQCHGKIS